MVTTRRQRREEEEKIRRAKLWYSISNDLRKRRISLLNSIATDGITSEIVLRLPVDTLSRFKCASKTWYTLLHEPSFIKMHLNRSIRNNTFAFVIYDPAGIYSVDYDISSSRFNKAVQIERPFMSSINPPVLNIRGSCNGIFLITTFYQYNRICLWNPSTREYKDISQQFSKTPKYPRELYAYEWIGYWLGYDLSTDDYKVIRIAYHHNFNNGGGICDVHVYSMRTDSCNRIQQAIPYTIYGVVSLDTSCPGGILLNGAIHWLGEHGSTYGFLWTIVTFDLANEDFKDFQLPGEVVSSKSIRLGMFEGCLCTYSVNKDNDIDMFVMKEYGVKESWTKMFSIIKQSIGAMRCFKPLGITNEGKLLVQLNHQDLALYDPNNGGRRCGNIKIQGLPRRISNFFRIETYVKSFVSLGTNTNYVI